MGLTFLGGNTACQVPELNSRILARKQPDIETVPGTALGHLRCGLQQHQPREVCKVRPRSAAAEFFHLRKLQLSASVSVETNSRWVPAHVTACYVYTARTHIPQGSRNLPSCPLESYRATGATCSCLSAVCQSHSAAWEAKRTCDMSCVQDCSGQHPMWQIVC